MTEEPKSKSFEIALGTFIVLGLIAAAFFWQNARNENRALTRGMVEAINNARQIGFALFEFETEFGTYPDKKTALEVTASFPKHGLDLSGDSSNALFRQLIASGITSSEHMFYAKISGSRKPDGVISPGHALEKGEVGFGLVSSLSTAGNPARITVFCPIIPGTTKFDPKPFGGRAIALRVDNSATHYEIQEDGHIYLDGINLLSPKHPIWKGKAPDIRYPDL